MLAGLFTLLVFIGCQPFGKNLSGNKSTPLPPDITGTWQADDAPWRITLNPDGTIASAIIPMCEVEVRPNHTTKVEMLDGKFSTFNAGDFIVEYTPDTRQLYVSVEIKHLRVIFQDNRIEGNTLDRFIGTVSEDGKLWIVDWFRFFDYGPAFPQDQNNIDEILGQLVFTKVED